MAVRQTGVATQVVGKRSAATTTGRVQTRVRQYMSAGPNLGGLGISLTISLGGAQIGLAL